MNVHDSSLSPELVPDTTVSVREQFGIDQDLARPRVQPPQRSRTGHRRRLPFRPGHDARHSRRLRTQPAGDDPGLPRHRQVDAHRTGRGTPQLAVHPGQPRQPHQPHRPRRQGRDRDRGRPADHHVQGGDPAVGAAASDCAGVRRVRRRTTGRDVRDPTGSRSRGQAHPLGPEPHRASAPGVPAVLHHEYRRLGGHHRALPRHPADQPGPDGPLEHRDDA